jgi:ribosomal protein L37AE/L43A
MVKIKQNSKTNCPGCGKRKPFRYVGECPECTYTEENNTETTKEPIKELENTLTEDINKLLICTKKR